MTLLAIFASIALFAQTTTWQAPGTWDNGIPNPTVDAIINFDYALSTDLACNNLTINNGFNFELLPSFNVTVNGDFTNNGTCILRSSNLGDGSLIVDGSVAGSGTFSVERYLSGGQWHLVSAPVSGASASVFNGIWLRPYNEATNAYGEYIVPDATPLPVGQGFIAWTNSADTRVYSGNLNNGSVGPLGLQLTGLADINTGWNLVGNPYPSSIDWDAVSGWTKNSVANAVYVYNGTQYASYVGGTSVNGGSNIIAPGQGFFVQATANGASLSMDNDVRVHSLLHFMKSDTEPLNNIRINLSNSLYEDETVITVREFATENYDFENDAAKIAGAAEAPQMYTIKGEDAEMAIHSVASVDEVFNMPVFVEYANDGEHTITWSHTLTGEIIPVLFDNLTQTEISAGTVYTYNASMSDPTDRFSFKEISMGVDNIIDGFSFSYYNNTLVFSTDGVETEIYTIQGKKILASSNQSIDLSSLAKGMYIVKAENGTHTVVEKVIVK